MRPRIVIALGANALAKWSERLRAALPEAEIVTRDSARATVDEHATAADFALVWRPDPSFFAEQRHLKAIFNLGAGIDALATMPEFPRAVPLIRLEDAGMAEQMAEYAAYATLRAFREFAYYAAEQRAGRWSPRERRDKAAFGVGVLGLGVLVGSVRRQRVPPGVIPGGSLVPAARLILLTGACVLMLNVTGGILILT